MRTPTPPRSPGAGCSLARLLAPLLPLPPSISRGAEGAGAPPAPEACPAQAAAGGGGSAARRTPAGSPAAGIARQVRHGRAHARTHSRCTLTRARTPAGRAAPGAGPWGRRGGDGVGGSQRSPRLTAVKVFLGIFQLLPQLRSRSACRGHSLRCRRNNATQLQFRTLSSSGVWAPAGERG